jgi:hypothetical protein
MKQVSPSAVLKNGTCTLSIEGEQPRDVADRALEILEKIRDVTRSSKGFK